MKFLAFIFIYFCLTILSAKESNQNYALAYKVEKISPVLSINLYEKVVQAEKVNKKFQKNSLSRLFYLYNRYSMYEEIFILNENFPNDKSRLKKTDKIYQKISKNLKIEESQFKKIILLTVKKDDLSLRNLILEYNKTPNIYLLSYIFAIKLKQEEYEALSYIISEIPNINPVLKFYYYVKVSSKLTMINTVEKVLNEISSISELTNSQKADILFFYAMYLEEKKRFRQSIRFYRMSSTFSKKEDRNISLSNNQIAKIFLIQKQPKKACTIFNQTPRVGSESDEVIYIYCNKKQNLKQLKTPIQNLFQKEKSRFYKKILQEIANL